MDAYEINQTAFATAMTENRWADASATARRNIDIIRAEEGNSANFEYRVSRMNEAHLKRTLAAEIEAQDADITYVPAAETEDDEAGSTTPPNPFMVALTAGQQARRAAQAEHDRLDQLAGVIHAHVASNINGLPAEHSGGQTLFYSKWVMGRVCVVRDINTRRLMIAREYTRTVETFDMGELSSVRTETAYIGA